MNDSNKIPGWYWIFVAISLVWNLMGVSAFYSLMTITPEQIEALSEAEQNLQNSYPLWTDIAFAVAVFGGTLGCIGLILKKKWSRPVFIFSLIAVIAQMGHSVFIAKSTEVYGPGSLIMPIMVIAISGLLVYFSDRWTKAGWLN